MIKRKQCSSIVYISALIWIYPSQVNQSQDNDKISGFSGLCQEKTVENTYASLNVSLFTTHAVREKQTEKS